MKNMAWWKPLTAMLAAASAASALSLQLARGDFTPREESERAHARIEERIERRLERIEEKLERLVERCTIPHAAAQ